MKVKLKREFLDWLNTDEFRVLGGALCLMIPTLKATNTKIKTNLTRGMNQYR